MNKLEPTTAFVVEQIPLAMREAPRWVCWRAVKRDDRWTKLPVNARTRENAKSNDPKTWCTFDEAERAATADPMLGIGFVLGDSWLGVDLDGIVDPASGEITNPEVAAWLATTESFAETTPSKTGLHVIFKGVGIPAWSQNRRGFVEVYADKRFFTVTGHTLYTDRDVLADQAAVDALCDKWLRRDKPKPPSPAGARRKRNPDDSADDYSLACDLARKGTPRAEIEAKLAEKMIAEGRGDKAGRADYVPRTVDAAERAVEADPTPPGAKTADKLVALALDRFELGCTPKREPFAVDKLGPNVSIPLDAKMVEDFLADLYFEKYGATAGSSAIAEALSVLRGRARKSQPTELAVRYARHEGNVVVDLGGIDGRAVMIEPNGWRILDRSPVVFSRSELTIEVHPLSEAIEIEEGLSELRTLLNVGGNFDLLVGWISCGMCPHLEHPVLKLTGGQGVGKSTAAKTIVGILDASSAPLRSPPSNLETYSLQVAGAWLTLIENISDIPEWMSDAMCRTVSGDSFVRRKLYTDHGLSVTSFRRVIGMATIDVGALRGDLADRVLEIELQPIDESETIDPAELAARIDSATPKLVGTFYTLVSKVLAVLPTIKLDKMPRMADFARVLAALDQIRGTDSLGAYLRQRDHLAGDVLEGDIVGNLVQKIMENRPTAWVGNSESLLSSLRAVLDEGRRSQLPKNPRQLSGCLRRVIPALRKIGIEVTPPPKTDKTRTWRLTKIAIHSTMVATDTPGGPPPAVAA
jgi:hypothetical protein